MSIKLAKFMQKLQKEDSKLVEQIFGKPVFDPTKEHTADLEVLAKLNRPPFPAQVEQGILPLKAALEKYNAAILLGEMGIGKTQISISLIPLLEMEKRKVLFLASGSKHLRKMEREAKAILGESKVVVYTIVNSSPKRNKNEILPEEVISMEAPEGKYLFFLLSKDTAKFSLQEDSIANWGEKCPTCGKEIWPASWNEKKIAAAKSKGSKPKYKVTQCNNCGVSLTKKVAKNIVEGELIFPQRVAKNKSYKNQRRISVGERLKNLLKSKADKVFDYMIVDEVHEMQNALSLQGKVYRDLVDVSHKKLIMTGTLTNGYTSSLYYILFPVIPWYFREKGYDFYSPDKFVNDFGQMKRSSFNSIFEKGRKNVKLQELPKTSERIIGFLSPFTVWVKIQDLNLKMPSYSERAVTASQHFQVQQGLDKYKSEVVKYIGLVNKNYTNNFGLRYIYIQNNPFCEFSFEIVSEMDSTHENYANTLSNVLGLGLHDFVRIQEVEVKEGVRKIQLNVEYPGINRILQSQLTAQANVDEVTVDIDVDGEVTQTEEVELLPEDIVLPKEEALINSIKADLAKGRNVLLYSIYNNIAKVDKRLYKILLQSGVVSEDEIAILPENLQSKNIEKWIEDHPVKVLIASPIKLATGLDLVQFPSIKFYETGVNLRVIQQASRRSWRAVGQKFPVEIEFFAYAGIQAELLNLIGKKLKSAAVVDGRKVDDSQLASVFDDDKALTRVLNKISEEIENSEEARADFSNIYEVGKLRPLTKLEAQYKELLDAASINVADNDDLFSGADVEVVVEDDEVEVEEIKTEKEIEVEIPAEIKKVEKASKSSKQSNSLFDFASEEEVELEEVFDVKIELKGNQYVFSF